MYQTNIELSKNGFSEEEYENVMTCLHTLFSIWKGSQPLDRDLGISMDMIDDPLPIAENKLSLDIIEQVKKYEPRVWVESVRCELNDLNKIIAYVKFKKSEEY